MFNSTIVWVLGSNNSGVTTVPLMESMGYVLRKEYRNDTWQIKYIGDWIWLGNHIFLEVYLFKC